jgi:hypothetical protein
MFNLSRLTILTLTLTILGGCSKNTIEQQIIQQRAMTIDSYLPLHNGKVTVLDTEASNGQIIIHTIGDTDGNFSNGLIKRFCKEEKTQQDLKRFNYVFLDKSGLQRTITSNSCDE